MVIVTTCLFIAACLPFLSKIPLALAMNKESKYDNHHPREQQKRLKGFGARAYGAHQNSFEALLIFGLAIISAMATHNITSTINILSIMFIVSRLGYHFFYLMDFASIRSLLWFVGFLSSMVILGLSI
jgi:uncharacterized MAPEG superfamily protein